MLHIFKNQIKPSLFSILVFLILFVPFLSFAKSYEYANIDVYIKINKDSTIDVAETQTYDFQGEFHNGWREIPLNKLDGISDIEVYDANSGKKLEYSFWGTQNNNPADYGKYSVFKQNGAQVIKWHFKSPQDTSHWQKTFIIKYKAHGAISFLKNADELYWNFFTNYSVPVHALTFTVKAPEGANFIEKTFYIKPDRKYLLRTKNNGLIEGGVFETMPPHTKATIAVSFTKGIVSKFSYWTGSFLRFHWWKFLIVLFFVFIFAYLWFSKIRNPKYQIYKFFDIYRSEFKQWIKSNNITAYTIAIFIIISGVLLWFSFITQYEYFGFTVFALSLLYALFRWLKLEYIPIWNKTIIPRYSPPQNLTPAMTDLILHERVTKRALPATVVHLATKGVLKIAEFSKYDYGRTLFERIVRVVKGDLLTMVLRYLPLIFILIITVVILAQVYLRIIDKSSSGNIHTWLTLFIFSIGIFVAVVKIALRKDYKIIRTDSASLLLPYEKLLLWVMFTYGDDGTGVFTTEEFRNRSSISKTIYHKFKNIIKRIYKDTQDKAKAYDVGVGVNKSVGGTVIAIGFFTTFFLATTEAGLNAALTNVAIFVFMFAITEARLSKKGNQLKADILGFKLYLKTAERYRMQNLTPETFEKYLPYAMVFGVEKKWAKAFEYLNIPVKQPQWYSGSFAGAGGFSASNFSSSFSASFVSSFSSSAGGASDGGGVAGGGAGGGGGGAS